MQNIIGTQSTTGNPSAYGPYQLIDQGLRKLLVDRLGVSEYDVSTLQAGGAVVGIVFPADGGELSYPVLVVAVRGGSDQCIAAATRISTAVFRMTWQTQHGEVLSCDLYTPGQRVHRESGEYVFRKFVCMVTRSYNGIKKSNRAFMPLQDFRRLISLELLYGTEGRYGEFGPIVPRVNSGDGLRSVRFVVPLDTVPLPIKT